MHAFFALFFRKEENCNKHSDVAGGVLFPSVKSRIPQEVQDRLLFALFEAIFSTFIGHGRQLDSQHSFMSLSIAYAALAVYTQTYNPCDFFLSCVYFERPTQGASKKPQRFCLSRLQDARTQTCLFFPVFLF